MTSARMPFARSQSLVLLFAVILFNAPIQAFAQTRTWDGQHDSGEIALKVVYFVPNDREPLPDWRDRVDYYCRRLQQFHEREFQGQSELQVELRPEPFVSQLSTAELRAGDADAIFFKTLREVDEAVGVTRFEGDAFPILLVLSEINWRPLDDFYRVKPNGDAWEFEGNYNGQEHFPGATSGGARATYLARPGAGWGLVSADGWRVPYRGSDCVIYHEGLGHTVGLPHPEPGNGSVMSLGQYNGWLSESWLDDDQKERLNWSSNSDYEMSANLRLFSEFRALPVPRVPSPGELVVLELDWPEDAKVESLKVRYQTAIDGPWIESPQVISSERPEIAAIGSFERPTPVSYRIDARLTDGSTCELWGYFQVRQAPNIAPTPLQLSDDLQRASTQQDASSTEFREGEVIDLLQRINLEEQWQAGEWTLEDGVLESPKQYGARIELPYSPSNAYRLVVVLEPLDEPQGFLIGQRCMDRRFATLFNYQPGEIGLSAIENIDGQNVGNASTREANVLKQGMTSQIITTVTPQGVKMEIDGQTIVDWKGNPERLSLSDYWSTPNERALFIGAYDCRYRIHRITLESLEGEGEWLTQE